MMAFKPLHVFVIRDRNAALDWEELLQRDCAFRVTAADPSKPYGKQITCEKPDVILLDLADVRKEKTILETIQNEACYPVLAIAAGGNPAPNGKMTSVLPRRNLNSEDDVNRFATMVSIKLKDLGSRYSGAASEAAKIRASRSGSQRLSTRLIVLGASMGGVEATVELLQRLDPAHLPGILIVQHMQVGFSASYAGQLDRLTPFDAREAKDGDAVRDGTVLVACSGKQMALRKKDHAFAVHVYSGEPVNGFCPSADVLFSSAAECAGKKATGVILTGIGSDGAKGLLAMHRQGSYTWGQNEESCVVYGMPLAAKKLGAVDKEGSIASLAAMIQSYYKNY